MHLEYINGIIFLASLCGLAVAVYIRYKKTRKEILVCPIHFNCEDVIHSKYATVLGVPIEIIGLFYYGFLALIYGTAIMIPEIITAPIGTGLTFVTSLAMVFSIYLLFVQVILKQWCAWCLLSFVSSVVIFYCVVLV
ncbi:MAG: vitamin K epoxide reductase family protein [Candidatus Paceibacterota bacterium]